MLLQNSYFRIKRGKGEMFVAGCPTFSLSVFIQDEQAEKKNTFRMEHYLTISPDLHCVVCTLSGIKTFILIHILMAGVMQNMRCTCCCCCCCCCTGFFWTVAFSCSSDHYYFIISTEGALRIPTTYDNHWSHPNHPSIPSTYSIEDDLSQLRWPKMT